MTTLRLFISSPGDVGEERAKVDEVCRRLNDEFAGTGRFDPYFWEHDPMRANQGFQEQIPRPSDFDAVICILWSRLGTRLNPRHRRADGTAYASGTEFEFEDALESFRQRGRPELFVYRRDEEPRIRVTESEDRLAQWRTTEAFCEKWFKDARDGTFQRAYNRYRDIEEFERKVEQLLRELAKRFPPVSNAAEPPAPAPLETHRRPYRGLEVFDFEHEAIFFGRTRAIGDVLAQLRQQIENRRAFVLLFGASGSGKSSLMRAGVLPRLAKPGVLEGVGALRRALVQPAKIRAGLDLIGGLAEALLAPDALPELRHALVSPTVPDAATALAQELRDDPDGAAKRIAGLLAMQAVRNREREQEALAARARAADERGRSADATAIRDHAAALRESRVMLAVTVDQLEEMFTLADRFSATERPAFVRALDALARSGCAVVLATLRSDFYARCAELPGLVALKSGAGEYQVLSPSEIELGQMIRFPAQAAGLRFQETAEQGRLDERLRDIACQSPGALPLLEFVLDKLYEVGAGDRLLTHKEFEDIGGGKNGGEGGFAGVLNSRAEEVFTGLPAPAQGELRSVFRKLATRGDGERGGGKNYTRKVAELSDFPEGSRRRVLVDALADARLLTRDKAADGRPVVSVAHETLLADWKRLRDQLAEDDKFFRVNQELERQTQGWLSAQRHPDLLLPEGLRLAEAEQALHDFRSYLTAEVIEFIERSGREVRARARRRTRLLQGALALFAALGALAAWKAVDASRQKGEALTQRAEADQQRSNAVQNARQVQRTLSQSDFLQAGSSLERGDTRRAVAFLARAVRTWPENLAAAAALASELEQQPSARPLDGLLADITYGRAALSPDGRRWVRSRPVEEATGVEFFDVVTGRPLAEARFSAGSVRQLEFSADGRRAISVHSHDEAERSWAQVWDATTGQKFGGEWSRRGGEDGGSTYLAGAWLNRDGSQAIAITPGNEALIWDVGATNAKPRVLRHPGPPQWAAFSPDGRWLLTCSDGAGRTNRLGWFWDVVHGTNDGSPLLFSNTAARAVFSADGQWFVTVTLVGGKQTRRGREAEFADFQIWKTATRTPVGGPIREFTPGHSVHFHPRSAAMLVVADTNTVQIFDLETAQPLGPALAFREPVHDASFSRDGRFVLTANRSGWVRLTEAATGRDAGAPRFLGPFLASAQFVAEDRGILGMTDSNARVVDTLPRTSLPVLLPHRTYPGAAAEDRAAFSPDGRQVVTSPATNAIRVWDVETGVPLTPPMPHDSAVRKIRFSPDGRWLLTTSGTNTLTVWENATGRRHGQLVWSGRRIEEAAFFHAPDHVVLMGQTEWRRTAGVWSVAGGKSVAAELVLEGLSPFPVMTRDWHRFVVESNDTARVVDLTPAPVEAGVLTNLLSADEALLDDAGRRLALKTQQRLDVWELPRGEKIGATLWLSESAEVRLFSPDGRWLQTEEESQVRLWDLNRGQPFGDALPHSLSRAAAPFSPDSRWILTASARDRAQLWETGSTRPIGRALQHPADLAALAFSPDGRRFLTVAGDGWARVWDAALPRASELLAQLAEIVEDARLSDMGSLEPLKQEAMGDPLGPIHAALERRPADDPEARFIRWFLADTRTRTMAPFSKMTLPQYVERLLENATEESLREVLGLSVGNPELLQRIDQLRAARSASSSAPGR